MDFDQGVSILKSAIAEMLGGGFPKEELAPLFADFTFMTALAAAGPSGVATMLYRIRKRAEIAEREDYGASNGESAVALSSRAEEAGEEEFDGSPVRIAMEHLLSHQGVPLVQAAAACTTYALMLVFKHAGADRAQALVNRAQRELDQLNAQEQFANASAESAYLA